MEAKLNAASETLDENEKKFNETVAKKDGEIWRLSEEVRGRRRGGGERRGERREREEEGTVGKERGERREGGERRI